MPALSLLRAVALVADRQILNAATSDAASDYVLPASIEFLLKAVRAEFRDNGAGSDWLPAVVVTSDSGHTIATAADQGAKVTAGGGADASFFPGVKAAAASSAALLDLLWCYVEGNMGMDGSNLSYFDLATPDAAAFDLGFGTPNIIRILDPGTYLIFLYSEWTTLTGAPVVTTRVVTTYTISWAAVGGTERLVHDGLLGLGSNDVSGVAGHFVWQTHGIILVNTPSGSAPATIHVAASNTALSNKTSDDTAVTVVRISETPLAGAL